MDSFQERGSDLVFQRVLWVDLPVSLARAYEGRGAFILPSKLVKSRSVINVNATTQCFKYAVLAALHYEDVSDHRQRASKYQEWINELDFGNLDIDSISVRDVPKIEALNNLKINVHLWDDILRGPLYNARQSTAPRTVNLLLVNTPLGQHYCAIVSLSALYHHEQKCHHTKFFCERCCRHFFSKDLLDTHFEWCVRGKLQVEEMPKEKEFSYQVDGHELSPMRIVYSDIECYIDPNTDKTHFPAAVGCRVVWHP